MEKKMIWPRKFYLAFTYIFARTIPRILQLWIIRIISRISYFLMGKRRRAVQENLSGVLKLPLDDRLVKSTAIRTFRNYGIYLTDYVRLNRLSKYLLPEEKGKHHIKQALADGNGAILIMPHLGNWELGGVLFAMRECPIHALTLKDPETEVQNFRDKMRKTIGIETVHIDPSNFGNILKLVKLLKKNQVIAMLGDRFEGGKKVEVTFFSRKVIFPGGTMALALNSGAPVIPVFTVIKPDGHYAAWMEAPIRATRSPGLSTSEIIEEKTQELATVFEKVISRYPDQWYHSFNYWERYANENSPS